MNKLRLLLVLSLLFFNCQKQEKTFDCNGKKITISLPKIIKEQASKYTEGKAMLLITKDSVFVEFYCGGNYSSIVSNKSKYKVLTEQKNSKRGIDVTTGNYWRKDGKLSYFNCKAKDTTRYNRIFDSKSIEEIN